ncbi:MAG: MATE family efflux transporter [candidate division Zixibacteria bacterium]|nr:MATE family efflux transporter [candidate division Zixibacteria bacterium]
MLDLSERNLNRTIIALAWPAILENLLRTSVYIVDSIFVGQLGTLAFAAVGQSSMVLFTVVFTFFGVGVATGAIVARNLGRGDRGAAGKAAGQGILLGTGVGALLAVAGILWGEWLLAGLGTDLEVIDAASGYMYLVFLFSPVQMYMYIASGILRSAGDTKTPMWSTGIMNVFNIVGDWVLIFGIGPFPEMGIEGAALATGLSYLVGAAVLSAKLFAPLPIHVPLFSMFRIDLDILRTLFRISLPNIGEQVVLQGAYFMFMWMVTGLGTTALAAHFMAIRVEMISFMPVFGLSMAVSTVVGQSLGAGRPEIAELAVRRSARIGLFSMGALCLVFIGVPGLFVSMFSPTPDVYALSVLCVRLAALELPTSALLMIYGGAMRGAGDTLSPMLISLFGAIFLRIGVIYLLVVLWGGGLPGVWLGTAIDWGIRTIIGYVLFRRGRWKKVNL